MHCINLLALDSILLSRWAGTVAAGFGVIADELRSFSRDLSRAMNTLRQLSYESVYVVSEYQRRARISKLLIQAVEKLQESGAELLAWRSDDRTQSLLSASGSPCGIGASDYHSLQMCVGCAPNGRYFHTYPHFSIIIVQFFANYIDSVRMAQVMRLTSLPGILLLAASIANDAHAAITMSTSTLVYNGKNYTLATTSTCPDGTLALRYKRKWWCPVVTSSTNAAQATYKAQLAWAIPSTRANGTPLGFGELRGYEVYYTNAAGTLNIVVPVSGATTTTITIGNLSAGTYYFAITAIDNSGLKSSLSPMVSATFP